MQDFCLFLNHFFPLFSPMGFQKHVKGSSHHLKILNLITSVKTLFPNRVTVINSGDQDLIALGPLFSLLQEVQPQAFSSLGMAVTKILALIPKHYWHEFPPQGLAVAGQVFSLEQSLLSGCCSWLCSVSAILVFGPPRDCKNCLMSFKISFFLYFLTTLLGYKFIYHKITNFKHTLQ